MKDYPTFRVFPSNTDPVFSDSIQNKVFISFGGPTEGYHNLVKKIAQETQKLGFFTHIMGFTDLDLKRDPHFWERHGSFIEKNRRGYGYWLWKPYLIHLVLNRLNEDDILVYADAGSTVNLAGLERMEEYVNLLKNSEYGVISYQFNRWPEQCWNKKILLNYMGAYNESLHSGQCVATIIIIKKNAHSTHLINQWYEIASIHELLDDSKTSDESKKFIEHRHDQSIYSLLVKKYGSIKIHEDIYDRKGKDWNHIPFQGTQIHLY
ncbi:MAG: hypothetical protein ACH350_02040 [Parachlamydiaceae bacterium]